MSVRIAMMNTHGDRVLVKRTRICKMRERGKELNFVWVFPSDVFGDITAPCGREVTKGTLIGLFTRVGAEVFRQIA